jgi:hypothetical protein
MVWTKGGHFVDIFGMEWGQMVDVWERRFGFLLSVKNGGGGGG